jgi:hypothetical protein
MIDWSCFAPRKLANIAPLRGIPCGHDPGTGRQDKCVCDVHLPSIRPIGQSGRAGGSLHVFKQFAWLGVGSINVALLHPAQQ